MKQFGKGHRRLLSMLLSLVLLVGLVPVIGLPASAENLECTSVTKTSLHPSGCIESITISYKSTPETYLATVYGKFAIHNGPYQQKEHGYNGWEGMSSERTFLASQTDDEYEWTKDQHSTAVISRTVHFADNIIKPNTEYYLYLWTRADSHIYIEQFFAKIRLVDEELQVLYKKDDQFDPLTPAHVWNSTPVTTGNGTKQAATTLTCSCGKQVRVSLTASDVTLPGNAFSAKIDVEELQEPIVATYALRAATQLPAGHELTVSDTPGYKYSPDGTNFTDIDPASFTPAPGFYQASILVKDAASGNQLENLYVTYTVSDPAVTAETGDSRPIELMVMGMALFSALAIAAFALDCRRRSSR